MEYIHIFNTYNTYTILNILLYKEKSHFKTYKCQLNDSVFRYLCAAFGSILKNEMFSCDNCCMCGTLTVLILFSKLTVSRCVIQKIQRNLMQILEIWVYFYCLLRSHKKFVHFVLVYYQSNNPELEVTTVLGLVSLRLALKITNLHAILISTIPVFDTYTRIP